MALLSKKPTETSSSAPLYTMGSQKTVLLVGLGNLGREYDGTRHNIGFACVDAFASAHESLGAWTAKKDLKCQLVSANMGTTRVIVIKPTTFMNLSGEAVQAVQNFYKIPTSEVTVVYDELDMAFGQLRMRNDGGSAGHNGIKSIIQHCGDNFGRIRIGINNEQRAKNDEKDFVLKKFNSEEQSQLVNLSREVTAILTELIYSSSLPAETRSFLV